MNPRTTLTVGLLALALAPVTAQVESIRLSRPVPIDGIRVAADGSLIAASSYAGRRVWRIAADGTVNEIAAGVFGPIDVVTDRLGRFYVSNFSNEGTISRIEPDGRVETFAALEPGPSGLAFGPDGWLYAAIYGQNAGTGQRIYRIGPTGKAEVFVEGHGLDAPVGITFDDKGNLLVVNAKSGEVLRVAPDRSVSVFARLPRSSGMFSAGHLARIGDRYFVSGNHSHVVYLVQPDGQACVFAGTGEPGTRDGPAREAQFTIPNGLAVSPDNRTLFVVNGGGGLKEVIRKISLPPLKELTCPGTPEQP